jgi:DNA-directed RNA polymerase subunit beta'
MEKTLSEMAFNPLDMMVDSGARGNSQQIRQIAGMKGLVSNPRGEMIPRPIKSSFREGLSVLEYFISTHGARKGLADTALRTADSGYLTRRLVDVAQELIVRIDDCETARSVWLDGFFPDEAGRRSYLETRAYGRVLAEDTTLADGTVLTTGTVLDDDLVALLRDDPQITRARVRSVLTCESEHGVCATCYGQSLATGRIIELGEAVGVIAAQSIGEPGTQLTMHHPRPAPGRRALRGPDPEGCRRPRPSLGRRPDRRRGGWAADHRGGRRWHRGVGAGERPGPPRGEGRAGGVRR